MTIYERLQQIKSGHWLLITASAIEYTITGTRVIGIEKDGTVEVEYLDGCVE